MRKIIITSSILLLALMGCGNLKTNEKAETKLKAKLLNCMQNKQNPKSNECIDKFSLDHNAHALYIISQIYKDGYQEHKGPFRLDRKKYSEILAKSANLGYDKAQSELGEIYYRNEEPFDKYDDKTRNKYALKWFTKAVKQGNVDAQTYLGEMYYHGYYVKKDHNKAKELFLKSAKSGNEEAQYNIGVMYNDGDTFKKDNKQTFKWWLLSAKQGDVNAQYQLGLLYKNGQGVKQDYTQAFYWLKKSALQSDSPSQNLIGFFYFSGKGVKKDLKKALYWFKRSAELGNTTAQHNIASIYTGKSKDHDIEAYAWETLAQKDDYQSDSPLKTLKKRMSRADIKKAIKLSKTLLR